MNIGSDRNAVRAQYGTAQRLDTRISIHNKYSVNRTGFATGCSRSASRRRTRASSSSAAGRECCGRGAAKLYAAARGFA